jgi:hypothetical protein
MSASFAPMLEDKRTVARQRWQQLGARGARVRDIAEGNFGAVISRDGDIMHCEVPADVSIGLNAVWGQIGVIVRVVGQSTRLSERRIIAMNGATVVCNRSRRRSSPS